MTLISCIYKQFVFIRALLSLKKCDGSCRTDFKKTRSKQDVIQVFNNFVEGNFNIIVSEDTEYTKDCASQFIQSTQRNLATGITSKTPTPTNLQAE